MKVWQRFRAALGFPFSHAEVRVCNGTVWQQAVLFLQEKTDFPLYSRAYGAMEAIRAGRCKTGEPPVREEWIWHRSV